MAAARGRRAYKPPSRHARTADGHRTRLTSHAGPFGAGLRESGGQRPFLRTAHDVQASARIQPSMPQDGTLGTSDSHQCMIAMKYANIKTLMTTTSVAIVTVAMHKPMSASGASPIPARSSALTASTIATTATMNEPTPNVHGARSAAMTVTTYAPQARPLGPRRSRPCMIGWPHSGHGISMRRPVRS